MDQSEGYDLLDLHWENAAVNEISKTPPAAKVAPGVAASPASVLDMNAVAGDAFADDDWDVFQSAPPAQSAAKSMTADPFDGFQSCAADISTNDGSEASVVADTVGSFDPILSPNEQVPKTPDPFTCLETLDSKPAKSNDNLISLNSLDEFDPVTQKKLQEQQSIVSAPAHATPRHEGDGSNNGDLLGLSNGKGATVTGDSASMEEEEVLGADMCPDASEADDGKKMVYVYHKGEKNVVGWYSGMKAVDIKEAILCACDAIIDGGFVLREVQITGDDETTAEPKENGKIFQYENFDQLEHEQTYIIQAAKERDDLKNITGDRWRRLKIHVEPLLHVEAIKAIERMRKGSNLLKHTHYGFPHLRQFQLSDDRKRLIWYSGAKMKEDCVIQLEEVSEIRLGQTTPVFLHYRLPMLEHLSFSLVYSANGSKTLDLTCKDEFEFDHWITGLKAVLYDIKNRPISKEELLGHSKRFQKALEKNNVGIKLTKLPEVKEKGHVGLDDCIEIATHTPQQLETKTTKLRERLKTMSQQVARLDHHSLAEMEVDVSVLTGQGPAYASVFVQDEDAQDEEMEIRRMHELVEQTTQLLQQAQTKLHNLKKGKTSDKECKQIDQILWKAEVDLENVEDMYLRHVDNAKDTATPFSISIAEMNQTISQKFTEFRAFFG